jgi:G3E family GTPase
MHPERLAATIADLPNGIIRAKGLLHVAGRPEYAMNLSVAGEQAHVDVSGRWIDSLSETRKQNYRQSRNPDWDDTWGDRKTQLIIIGRDMNIEAIEDVLDACLCSKREFDGTGAENPFPRQEGEEIRL